MKSLDQTQKKVLLFWIIFGILILVLFFCLRFFKIDLKKHTTLDKEYHLVTDYSRYYTVSSTIDKFYQFLNAGKKESVLHILEERYKEEHNLTEENVLKVLKKENVSLSFQSGLMCEKRMAENIIQYIVKGKEVGLNNEKRYDEKYYQIVLDESSFHFSICLIDAKTFGDECHE